MYKLSVYICEMEKEKKALQNENIQRMFVHVKCRSPCPLEILFPPGVSAPLKVPLPGS